MILASLSTTCMSTPRMQTPIERRTLSASSAVSGLRIVVMELRGPREAPNYEGPVEYLGVEASQQLARGLAEKGVDAIVSARGSAEDGDVIVRGEVSEIHGGSKGGRFWVGFGVGAARCRVRGTVEDSQGRVMGRFGVGRSAAFGSLGSVHLIERCLTALGRDVAQMIVTGRYREESNRR